MPKAKKPKKTDNKKKNPAGDGPVEYFDIEKDGKEETIQKEIKEETSEKKPSEDLLKKENQILKWAIIIAGIFLFVFIAYFFTASSLTKFNYKGIGFEITKEIAPYKTSFPVNYQGNVIPYNFYLRKDPRTNNVTFRGEINLQKMIVVNATNSLNCGGDGIISVANIANLQIFGAKVIKDQNATCDSKGRYMFINIAENSKSSIEQFGPSCYQLNVNNCKILEVTEKFMVEYFAKVKSVAG